MLLLSLNPNHGWDLVSPCTQPRIAYPPRLGLFLRALPPRRPPPLENSKVHA